jgi:hypothetical protein
MPDSKLPYVSSEGGPLLIGDAGSLRDWHGAFGDQSDYNRACEIVREKRVGCLNGRILVWDIEGAGTAFLIHYDSETFHLVRLWTDDDQDDDSIRGMIRLTKPTGERSLFRLTSSPAIIVWACEETTGMIIGSDAIPGVPSGDWSMGGTVYCFPVTPGQYSAEVGRFDRENIAITTVSCRLSGEKISGMPSKQ